MKKWIIFIMIGLMISQVIADDNSTCKQLYYIILNNQVNSNINNTLNLTLEQMNNLTNNYNQLCYLKGYSDAIINPPQIIFINHSQEYCSNEVNPIFEPYIPFFEFNLGELDCSSNYLNYIFYIEKGQVEGIRLFSLFLLIFFILILLYFKTSKQYKKFINKNRHK